MTAVCSDGNWTSVPDCVSKCHTQQGKSTTSLDSYVNKMTEVIVKHSDNVAATEQSIKVTNLDFSLFQVLNFD